MSGSSDVGEGEDDGAGVAVGEGEEAGRGEAQEGGGGVTTQVVTAQAPAGSQVQAPGVRPEPAGLDGAGAGDKVAVEVSAVCAYEAEAGTRRKSRQAPSADR